MKSASRLPLVLVVDDDFEWAEFVRVELESLCEVLHAHNAGDARLLLDGPVLPSLIILDVVIPGSQDGFSLLRSLRQSERTSAIPVIMASSINASADMTFSSDDLGKYLGVAPVEFLDKPVAFKKLQQVVRSVLSGAGKTSASAKKIPAG